MNDRPDMISASGLSGTFHERLANTLCRIAGEEDPAVNLAVALTSCFLSEGHVCFDLRRPLSELTESVPKDIPSASEWIERISRSPLCSTSGRIAPLVLDSSGRLYLQRYHEYQGRLAIALRRFADGRLKIISGGPGTGKTTSVAFYLAREIQKALELQQPIPVISVMAPTGKAASRLRESFRQLKAGEGYRDPDVSEEALARIPDEALTIHRGIGISATDPGRVWRNAGNPLPADIVVVDECSMVDLVTMTRLLEAVSPDARLVLLGDRHQLVSVEAGSVFADICDAAATPDFQGSYTELEKNYRFPADSRIGRLAAAVHSGRVDDVLENLRQGDDDCVTWVNTEDMPLRRQRIVDQAIARCGWLNVEDSQSALSLLSTFRVICALRDGPSGVVEVNRRIEEQLVRQHPGLSGGRDYHHRPIIVTANDYGLGLFNGDTGLIVQESRGEFAALFPSEKSELRKISTTRLPPHESVFAMTIHKTQGSEMDHVAVVLPERDSPIATRELLYTAVTRARSGLTFYATEASVRSCVNATVRRMSGLVDELRRG